MKKYETRKQKLEKQVAKLNHKILLIDMEKHEKEAELDKYTRRHRSLKFDMLETDDVEKLETIYKFFDGKYPIKWQGGLRCDERGMKLHFWIDDDPDFLIIHLSSTSKNLCFSGSTSWIAKAPTLSDKVNLMKTIKQEILKIIKQERV